MAASPPWRSASAVGGFCSLLIRIITIVSPTRAVKAKQRMAMFSMGSLQNLEYACGLGEPSVDTITVRPSRTGYLPAGGPPARRLSTSRRPSRTDGGLRPNCPPCLIGTVDVILRNGPGSW